MKKQLALVTAVALAATSLSRPAQAYNWSTHSRMAEMAVVTMQSIDPIVFPPQAWSDEQKKQFEQFTAAVRSAPQRLEVLKSGLPLSSEEAVKLPFTPADGDLPIERYPYQTVESSKLCAYYDDLNLGAIDRFRIKDMVHVPVRPGGVCGMRIPQDQSEVLPKVMGFHAADVDDHYSDSVLWLRPSSAGGVGYAIELVNRAADVAVGMFLAPLVCLYTLVADGECDPDKAKDIATEINPVRYAAGLLPGVGYIRGGDYTGLWHFIDMGASNNRYNDHRGMFYEEAGPSYPGAVDVAIMVGADLTGLSLHAGASDGDDRYGENDRVSRGDLAWQAVPIGHLEFSPVDNLAKYGWDQYKNGGYKNAVGLGYVMHALGDASAPHHVTGTTSWGHRPYEEFAARLETDLLRFGDAGQRDRILMAAFQRWQALKANEDIRAYVTSVAQETYDSAMSDQWPFIDGASVEYLIGASGEDNAADKYIGTESRVELLLEQGSAAILAFLTIAADKAQDPGRDDSIDCRPGHFLAGEGCVPGPGHDPYSPSLVLDVCGAGPGTCQAIVGGTGSGGASSGGSSGSGGTPQLCAPGCGPSFPCQSDESCDSDGCCRKIVK